MTDAKLNPIEMHVVRGVTVTGGIYKIHDYRIEDEKHFVGILLDTGSVVHIPTDRGTKMLDLAQAMLKLWNDEHLDYGKTNDMIKALFFEADVAIMITSVKTGPNKGQPQYRFYDATAPETFEPSPTTKQPRVKVLHEKGDATNGYMTI